MDPATPRIFDEPREETWATRLWDRWGSVLIVPLVLIGLSAFGLWYKKQERAESDRFHARMANMHRTVAAEVYERGLLVPRGSFIAPYPYGLYFQSEGKRDEWTIKLPMEWQMDGTGERRVGLAVAKIRVFEHVGGYAVQAFEVATPAGADLELTEKKLTESRSGKLWYVAAPPK